MNIKRILCPTDFSETSAHAVDWAVAMAGHHHAALTALHVVSPIEPWIDASLDTLRKRTLAVCASATASGVPLDVLLDTGQPVRDILARAASLPADLLVMGTHGTSGVRHLVLGSVTEKVLRHAPCPVLTVPPRVRADSHLPFRRILCALNVSDASASAVQCAASLAGESGARLTILHVIEWPWHEPPPPAIGALPPEQGVALATFRRDAEDCARKRLDSIATGLGLHSLVDRQIRSGKPSEQILDVAAAETIDLIVVGIGGRNAVDLAVLGSTTNHVVREAMCPVLTVPR